MYGPTSDLVAASTFTLAVTSSLRHLRQVRRFVVRHATNADFSDDAVEAFKLAVDEACTNIIKHAYEGKSGHKVEITIIVDPSCFTVRICDDGKPFDASTYSEPQLRLLTKQRRSGGLGVHIIRRLMDQVEYRTRDGKNEICLVKYRRQ